MTVLPSRMSTAGLKVPADSQVVPCGEMIGVSERRCQDPKGRSRPGCARERSTTKIPFAFFREKFIEVPSADADWGLHLMTSRHLRAGLMNSVASRLGSR